ncbi:MAG: ATP-binding cassette domain-containing protein [Ancalomicrobiaceae bacterium]|nr:ATP-binding cassette domain-containing protein [Ancalomicrobiaceae bacterium]
MIEIDRLSVVFGGIHALNRVTVTLMAPVSGIIGPNGAGKTTFLNVLSGFVRPAEGSVRMDGLELLALPPHARARAGLRRSFQREQVVDEMSVEDNVRVVLDPIRLSRAERARLLDRALDYCGLTAVRRERAERLNACERRMTELARTIVGSPQLVLLDEPGAGLSQGEVERLRQVIAGIHAFAGAQTLLIDHDVELIQAVCQDTMVLDFGMLIAAGPTADVLRDARVRAVYLGMEEGTA